MEYGLVLYGPKGLYTVTGYCAPPDSQILGVWVQLTIGDVVIEETLPALMPTPDIEALDKLVERAKTRVLAKLNEKYQIECRFLNAFGPKKGGNNNGFFGRLPFTRKTEVHPHTSAD